MAMALSQSRGVLGPPLSFAHNCSQFLPFSELTDTVEKRLMFLNVWMLSFALLCHSLIYSLSPTHNHTGPCQIRNSRATTRTQSQIDISMSMLACLTPPHSSKQGEPIQGLGGVRKASVCCPHLPSDGGGAWREALWLSLTQCLSLERAFLFHKPKPTSQLNPEKAESIRRLQDDIDLFC